MKWSVAYKSKKMLMNNFCFMFHFKLYLKFSFSNSYRANSVARYLLLKYICVFDTHPRQCGLVSLYVYKNSMWRNIDVRRYI